MVNTTGHLQITYTPMCAALMDVNASHKGLALRVYFLQIVQDGKF